jgi:hypothetical protein
MSLGSIITSPGCSSPNAFSASASAVLYGGCGARTPFPVSCESSAAPSALCPCSAATCIRRLTRASDSSSSVPAASNRRIFPDRRSVPPQTSLCVHVDCIPRVSNPSRSSYHVSDGSLDRTTGTPLNRLSHTLQVLVLIIQHTISLFRTRFFLGCLGVHSGAHQRLLLPDVLRTHRAVRGCTGMVGVAPLAALVGG